MTAWQMAAHTNSTRALGCRKVPIIVGGGGQREGKQRGAGSGRQGNGPKHPTAAQPTVTLAPQIPRPMGHKMQHNMESISDLGCGDRGMRKRKREVVSEEGRTGHFGSLSIYSAFPHGPRDCHSSLGAVTILPRYLPELRDPYKREEKAEPGMGPGLASGEAGSPGGAGGGHFSEPFQSQG